MILAQLLAAGRSLVSGEDRENRYKLPRHQWLPTFGAGRNPFDPEPKANRQPAPASSPQAVAVPASLPESVPGGESPRDLLPSPPAVLGRRPGWLSRLNPFALSSGGIPALRGQADRRNAGARQVELSLETVKVVRNDLSDGEDEKMKPLSAQRSPARTSNPERDAEEATVTRLNQSFRRAEQVSLF